jgi:hypothetical protein
MRRLAVALLIVVLGTSFFSALSLTLAQEPTEKVFKPPVIRWTHFRGTITEWGDEAANGSVVVMAKTSRFSTIVFRPWVTATAFWSNESRPIVSDSKPEGEATFTHYTARLVKLATLEGEDETVDINITGVWNVKKVSITSEFDENGALLKTVREVTRIVTKGEGQLLITEDWKEFDVEIEGIDKVKGIQISMRTTTRKPHPFSFGGGFVPTLKDLFHIAQRFRAMPGFGNYDPELDYNEDSKIDLTDLTTVAANM